MPNSRMDGTIKPPQNLSLEVFVKRLGEKNSELLSAFILGIENGELSLELDNADEWLHGELDEWCETEEPNRELHLRAISAITVWLIMDELYVEEIDAQDTPSPEITAEKVKRMAKLSVEAIRTVQAIWGLIHGKA